MILVISKDLETTNPSASNGCTKIPVGYRAHCMDLLVSHYVWSLDVYVYAEYTVTNTMLTQSMHAQILADALS